MEQGKHVQTCINHVSTQQMAVESTRRVQSYTKVNFQKFKIFLYSECDPDVSQNVITSSFGQTIPRFY